ncbi:hypothetical protein AHAT_17140 [Agarivorans sp. Toyoura001]|uniref:DUF6356 family protein n=1 Tax=Agarivorans sp. Toyoura001 TaxID=2283141 RepID=UPI0010DEA2FB|nr:DUF6356 family protein [Agarivorans sp. Toyoura001]GDY25824.1 hypothetical protein AHAT_17140 [Agarivorans sp. Toyoura001]
MWSHLVRIFHEHPSSVNESYCQHLMTAGRFSLRLFFAAVVCLVHAILPFAFVKTGSQQIQALHDSMLKNRQANASSHTPDSETQVNSFNFEI